MSDTEHKVHNHFSNCLGSALTAAQEIHTAMCLFDPNHAAQANLNRALHNALIVAEECRQAHKERKESSHV